MVLLSAPQDASYGHQSGHHWHHNSNTGGAFFTFYETFHASFLISLAFLSSNVQNICILLSFGCAAAFLCIFLRNGLFSRPLQCMACLHFHICTLNVCNACLCSTLHIMLAHTFVSQVKHYWYVWISSFWWIWGLTHCVEHSQCISEKCPSMSSSFVFALGFWRFNEF